ncbi:hypothetical protein BPNPMPFG_004862 [Mesorhizobium sp. AR07]|uniref:hypothetical protein n=1 Tax=Mesorhizobium sp. AR07 TaxID=2865838 RepID=UPI00215E68DB|nr:hypothetical protein [Mesorhizobium sp. AR07]UVK43108.1 hypothetical protein BPNPMPFG_004862 [Mesorhizobium sp. AR07]
MINADSVAGRETPVYSPVIPILNEKAGRPPLIRRIVTLLDTLDASAETVLVDDGSSNTSVIHGRRVFRGV